MRIIAGWHNARGMTAGERGDSERAVSSYRKAIRSDSTWSVPWYNLGLHYKNTRNWAEARRCNQAAVARDAANKAAWWNLGIAATALTDWPEARRAWLAYGLELPEGDGEFVGDFGYTPIRINPDDGREVIWANRIDPARAFIASVPLPESGRRHGDLLLHDGAPNGYRLLLGREVAVFDELAVVRPSPLGTFEATVVVSSEEDIVALEVIFAEHGGGAEDWSSIRYLCHQCSLGRPHKGHDRGSAHASGERRVGLGTVF